MFGTSAPLLHPTNGTINTIATRFKVIDSRDAGQDDGENLERILSPVVSGTFFTCAFVRLSEEERQTLFNNPYS